MFESFLLIGREGTKWCAEVESAKLLSKCEHKRGLVGGGQSGCQWERRRQWIHPVPPLSAARGRDDRRKWAIEQTLLSGGSELLLQTETEVEDQTCGYFERTHCKGLQYALGI